MAETTSQTEGFNRPSPAPVVASLSAFPLVISGMVQSVQELPPQNGSASGLTIVNVGGINIMARHVLRSLPAPGERVDFPCFTTVGQKGMQFWMVNTDSRR